MNTDPITDFIQNTERRDETHEKNPTANQTRLFGGRRVLGDGLGALRHGVLGKLTRQDQSDAAELSVMHTWQNWTGGSVRGLDLA